VRDGMDVRNDVGGGEVVTFVLTNIRPSLPFAAILEHIASVQQEFRGSL